MKLSGRMTRSTDECEMSRSCQSATFSKAAVGVGAQQPAQPDDLLAADRVALVRHRRRALLALGERLLDLADFGLLQAADLEGERLERRAGDGERRPSARRGGRAGSPAWRSAPASRPRRRQTSASIAGSRCANVPTAPEILPDADAVARPRRGAPGRGRAGRYHSASFRPNVIGSACTPCVRPIIGVCWCSMARVAHRVAQRLRAAAGSGRTLRPSAAPAPCRRRPTR